DEERRGSIGEVDSLKARRNAVSQEVGERKRRGEPADEVIAEMREVSERIRQLDGRIREIEEEIDFILLRIPNVPDSGVPDGGEESNLVVRSWGEPIGFSFQPRPHWELGAELGLIDLPAGAKVTGSGFPLFRGW